MPGAKGAGNRRISPPLTRNAFQHCIEKRPELKNDFRIEMGILGRRLAGGK